MTVVPKGTKSADATTLLRRTARATWRVIQNGSNWHAIPVQVPAGGTSFGRKNKLGEGTGVQLYDSFFFPQFKPQFSITNPPTKRDRFPIKSMPKFGKISGGVRVFERQFSVQLEGWFLQFLQFSTTAASKAAATFAPLFE